MPDYKYIEAQIIKSPDKLILHQDQFQRKSNGIVRDLAIRFALWELGEALHYRNSTDEADQIYRDRLKVFEKFVLEEVPQKAVRTLNNGDYVLIESLQGYYTHSLTVHDKLAAIRNTNFDQLEQMLIINAIMAAQEKYVNMRANQMVELLTGTNMSNKSDLSAVGDGSNWADLEGGFYTPFTRNLPDEKGLFRFNINQVLNVEKELDELKTDDVLIREYKNDGNQSTVMHFDVFGFHPERQTTLVIQKGGNSYVLYGKNEHRLVSPDSTYGEGVTYWRLMHELEFVHIAQLKEDLYGKRGYEYQIDLYEKKIESTKMAIKKSEYRLDVIRHTPSAPPKIKKKKLKKKDLSLSDQDRSGHIQGAMTKLDKKRNIEQNHLLQLNGILVKQKSILAKLKIEMEKAFETLTKYETKLDKMKKNMGYLVMEYEQDNHIYTFIDGATFNYKTQDFTFAPSGKSESFRVYHIAFGKDVFEKRTEENFTHIDLSYVDNADKYTMRKIQMDDQVKAFTASDSLQTFEIFKLLAQEKVDFNLTCISAGISVVESNRFKSLKGDQVIAYDPEHPKSDGAVLYYVKENDIIELQLTVGDDNMLPVNFAQYQVDYDKFRKKNPTLNEIDFYAGVRAKHEADLWIATMKKQAELWIKDEAEKGQVLKKLGKLKVKKVYFENAEIQSKVPAYIQ